MKNKIIAAALLLSASPVFAQPAGSAVTPAPIAAEKSIPLALALEAVQTAQAACAAKNSPTTAEIVDLNDNLKVLLSADGARLESYEYARRKAYTVLKKGMASGDFGKQVGPQAKGAPPIEGDVNLITFAGALPIMRGGAIIGAIAVSGPTGGADDAVCAQAGLDKIKDRL